MRWTARAREPVGNRRAAGRSVKVADKTGEENEVEVDENRRW